MFQSDLPPVPVGGTSVAAMVLESCRLHASSTALVDDPTGDAVTYAALADRIDRLAAAFAASGLGPGDVIAIWAPNIVPWAGVALGAMAAGCTVTGVSAVATDLELRTQLEVSGAKTLVTVGALADRAVDVANATKVEEVVVIGAETATTRSIFDLLASTAPPPDPRWVPDSACAVLPFSSGTTGLPKGVQLTHAAVVTMLRQLEAVLRPTPDDAVLALPPFPHVMGLVLTLLLPLATGATVVTMPRFEPDRLVPAVVERGITMLMLPPPLAGLLAAHPGAPDAFRRVRLIAFGGAPLPAERERAVAQRFPGAVVGQGWGMTELAVGATTPRVGARSVPGSVGLLLPNTELRVVDPSTGEDLGAGPDGELWVRGPQVMAGYVDQPEETAAILDRDGWLHTGDLGHIDAAGNVFVVDRLKELIKVKGHQVAPAELEALLVTHPDVADAAVTGRTLEGEEVPVAYVVASSKDIDTEEVAAYVAGLVSPYKRLRAIHVVESLPRTPSGKLVRRRLRPPPGGGAAV